MVDIKKKKEIKKNLEKRRSTEEQSGGREKSQSHVVFSFQKTAEIESSDGLITKKLKINLLQIQLLLRPKSLYPGMSIWETGE